MSAIWELIWRERKNKNIGDTKYYCATAIPSLWWLKTLYDYTVWEKLSKSWPFHSEKGDRAHSEAYTNWRCTLPKITMNVYCDIFLLMTLFPPFTSITEPRAPTFDLWNYHLKETFGVCDFMYNHADLRNLILTFRKKSGFFLIKKKKKPKLWILFLDYQQIVNNLN